MSEDKPWEPSYDRWRHGGWYVTNIHYPSGACGCVSNNYPDKKWRIACGSYYHITFSTRRDAACAEKAIIDTLTDLHENDGPEQLEMLSPGKS